MAGTPYVACGKQILHRGEHFCDARDPVAAERLVETLNRGESWDDEDIVTLMADAMQDAHGVDTNTTDFARAALAVLKREGLLP